MSKNTVGRGVFLALTLLSTTLASARNELFTGVFEGSGEITVEDTYEDLRTFSASDITGITINENYSFYSYRYVTLHRGDAGDDIFIEVNDSKFDGPYRIQRHALPPRNPAIAPTCYIETTPSNERSETEHHFQIRTPRCDYDGVVTGKFEPEWIALDSGGYYVYKLAVTCRIEGGIGINVIEVEVGQSTFENAFLGSIRRDCPGVNYEVLESVSNRVRNEFVFTCDSSESGEGVVEDVIIGQTFSQPMRAGRSITHAVPGDVCYVQTSQRQWAAEQLKGQLEARHN